MKTSLSRIMVVQPDPVSQEGAPVTTAARINRNDACGESFGPRCSDELVNRSALAYAGSSGDPYAARPRTQGVIFPIMALVSGTPLSTRVMSLDRQRTEPSINVESASVIFSLSSP
jgi:hypothetical protein